jgi:diguanylate cyclase (GGDEF)-like protein
MIYGPELGRRDPIVRTPFELGRSSRNDWAIDQEAVSRHHARILHNGVDYVVEDLGSTNGTWVNDARVASSPLADGDVLRIGRAIFKFLEGDNVEAHFREEIFRLMTVDALTRAYNRRFFDETLEREVNRARRYARPLSVVLFDIDRMRHVNDAYGYVLGDELLRQLAGRVGENLRREDVFCRVGGEEFGVILPEINAEGAKVTAERIRGIVTSGPFMLERSALECSVSLGLACYDKSLGMDTPKDLLAAAERALAVAKSAGRNCARGPSDTP